MPNIDRPGHRLAWTRQALSDPDLEMAVASADASFRSYWRTTSGGRSWIVMDAPPGQEDIAPWLRIGALLATAGLHTPAVHAADTDAGFVLMEDLGDRLYLPELDAHSADALYAPAIDAILTMQSKVASDTLPAFDEPWMVMELELMPEWFLRRHLGVGLECEDWDPIESAFRAILNAIHAQPQCFMHRDFHSRNLLVTPADSPGVIDFQDAVRGPITYDLVSLLRDAYVIWDEDIQLDYAVRFWEKARKAGLPVADDFGDYWRQFEWMGLQRHLKVLGIFARLALRDGKRQYLDDIPRVWTYAHRVASRYQGLGPLARLLEQAEAAHGGTQTQVGYTF